MPVQTEIPVATLETATTLTLPAETVSALGLHKGSRLAVKLTQGGILLQPLLADSLDELCGIFSSSPGLEEDDLESLAGSLKSTVDLVAELQRERRQDKW